MINRPISTVEVLDDLGRNLRSRSITSSEYEAIYRAANRVIDMALNAKSREAYQRKKDDEIKNGTIEVLEKLIADLKRL